MLVRSFNHGYESIITDQVVKLGAKECERGEVHRSDTIRTGLDRSKLL